VNLGGSLFLIAVGAILHFAVTADLAGIDIQVVGTILMVVGLIALAFSLWFYFGQRDRMTPPPPL
jgi:hypothetical protein